MPAELQEMLALPASGWQVMLSAVSSQQEGHSQTPDLQLWEQPPLLPSLQSMEARATVAVIAKSFIFYLFVLNIKS